VAAAPNPYEASVGHEPHAPSERIVCLFSAVRGAGAAGIQGRVLTAVPDAGAVRGWRHQPLMEARSPSRGRWQRPRPADPSAAETPLGPLVPSSSKRWLHGVRSPVRARLAGGAAHVNRGHGRHGGYGADVRVHATRRARGAGPTGSCAFAAAIYPPCQRVRSGGSHAWPVRRQARPLRALPHGRTWADQRPCGAVTCHTRHERICAPAPSTLAPEQVFSPSG
jgi:hypothetical protein